jgi:hypothetical protein
MTKFKFMAALGAASLITTGAMTGVAAAQTWRDHGSYGDYRNDNRGDYRDNGWRGGSHRQLNTAYVDSLEWRINHAAQQRQISWGEARELMREYKAVQPIAWRVETGQASRWEYQRLSRVVDRIEAATNRYARNEGYRGGRGYYR